MSSSAVPEAAAICIPVLDGHIWSIATHQEELAGDEVARRSEQWPADISSDSEKA
ncbi:hypothetical protein [Thalassomonas actiniarum]|uniref:Uncharacterized protein n=1 Tax=Thalassomonas actiniarum TaxID=485447 RepID=A0AAE9YRM6_9GAMM|nr:hypothetical protein [Thalassomonas actiniarum]WDD99780.1 hypothetical protein SG35_003665 [Thalassomonas actiniarum]